MDKPGPGLRSGLQRGVLAALHPTASPPPSSLPRVDSSRHRGSPGQAQCLHCSAAPSSSSTERPRLAQPPCRGVGSPASPAVLPTPPRYPEETHCTSRGSGSLLLCLCAPAGLRSEAPEERGKVLASTLQGKERQPPGQTGPGRKCGRSTHSSHGPCHFRSLQVLRGDAARRPPSQPHSGAQVPVPIHDPAGPGRKVHSASIPTVAIRAQREGPSPSPPHVPLSFPVKDSPR